MDSYTTTLLQTSENVTLHNSSSKTVYGFTIPVALVNSSVYQLTLNVTFDASMTGICIDDIQCEKCLGSACDDFVETYNKDLPKVTI